jgi:ABC-type glycerol-3-phosphate transport system permease component
MALVSHQSQPAVKKSRQRFRIAKWTSFTLTHLLAIGASLVFVYPVIWLLSASLKPNWEIYRAPLKLIPSEIQIDVYREIFSTTPIPAYMLNSVIYALGSLLITLFFALIAAYGLSRYQFRGKNTLLILILTVQLLPGLVRLIPLYLLSQTLGLYDSRFGITLIYGAIAIPFAIWFLKSYVDSVPRELDESAAIDGASRLRILFQIVAPTIIPGLAAFAILNFIQGWNEFQLASVMLRNPNYYPLTVGTYNLIGPDESNFRLIAAASLVNIVPILVVFSILQRYLVSGLAAGSVKG